VLQIAIAWLSISQVPQLLELHLLQLLVHLFQLLDLELLQLLELHLLQRLVHLFQLLDLELHLLQLLEARLPLSSGVQPSEDSGGPLPELSQPRTKLTASAKPQAALIRFQSWHGERLAVTS
jgi:hypothetical protein